uniref:Hexamerin 1 n=1 Tax=Campodea sp. CP-2009 TaxID=627589 RepID=C4PWQ0_9HEXA|nr:Hexamerin 1 precursor [Campodea sp. CP-2009]
MKFLLLALFAVAAASATYTGGKVDLPHKQQAILQLLWKVHIPIQDEELYQIGMQYNPIQHVQQYKELSLQQVQEIVEHVHEHKILSKEGVFNAFEEKHMQEAKHLFELLYFSKNFETFHKTALWAREHYNPGMFVYALTTAVIHMPYEQVDFRGITLPKLYEVLPNLYVPSKAVRKGYEAQYTKTTPVVTIDKYSSKHMKVHNEEALLDYFTEDMSLNAQQSMWHKSFPYWWNRDVYQHENDRQGELFLYVQHQLLNRYHLERIANRLPTVHTLPTEGQTIQHGYAPKSVYSNGQFMPTRPDYVRELAYEGSHYVQAKDWIYRIRSAIDAGYLFNNAEEQIMLNSTHGLDILGRIIQGSNQQYKPEYYGQLYNWAHKYYGRIADPHQKYSQVPSVLEHFGTAPRDPLFYRIQKTMNVMYKRYKDLLKPYTQEQLSFPGVQIKAVKVVGESRSSTPNTLTTHFEDHEFDLSNVQNHEQTEVKGLVSRLRHEPFQYAITVQSKVNKQAFVRIFLAPKYDYLGNKYELNEKRWYAVEMDKFVTDLKVGQNTIRRASSESTIVKKEVDTYRQMMMKVEQEIHNGQQEYTTKTHSHCGWPLHLLLPKGTQQGEKYTLYVVITDYDQDRVPETQIPKEHTSYALCGLHHDAKYPDNKPLGYPFDRRIEHEQKFFQYNMKAVDITIENVQ